MKSKIIHFHLKKRWIPLLFFPSKNKLDFSTVNWRSAMWNEPREISYHSSTKLCLTNRVAALHGVHAGHKFCRPREREKKKKRENGEKYNEKKKGERSANGYFKSLPIPSLRPRGWNFAVESREFLPLRRNLSDLKLILGWNAIADNEVINRLDLKWSGRARERIWHNLSGLQTVCTNHSRRCKDVSFFFPFLFFIIDFQITLFREILYNNNI